MTAISWSDLQKGPGRGASVTEDYVYDDADKLLEAKIGQQTVKEVTYDSAGRTTAVETSAGEANDRPSCGTG